MAEVITATELADYLGIDIVDDMVKSNLERVIKSADAYLRSAVGENYPADDPKAKEAALIAAADLYDNRSLSSSPGANVRKLLRDLLFQLRLEYMGAQEDG